MEDDRRNIVREEYIARINSVQDYIEANFSEEFSLKKLAEIANFSPYHFHRIFSIMTGETLFQFIQRIRLEKAGFLLLANPKTPIIEIALECGFSNQASFAKAFKNHFNMNASKFREERLQEIELKSTPESNMGKVFCQGINYNGTIKGKQCCITEVTLDTSFSVEVKEIPDMEVVYIRHTGPYKQDAALFHALFEKLYHWGAERGLMEADEIKWLTLFHDKLDLTEDHKLRISICMTVSKGVKVDGEVGRTTIPGGKYAVGHFQLQEDQYQNAWKALCGQWLPESGYQPDDRLCFELYPKHTSGDLENSQYVDIYIPIKPL
ncbi:AraC family transcriptional regulator [Natronincola peptidivorans]|uniref:AraC family transcriptional regulator n=1 Tax=Natronincola peptidivorans TaxID=426128 RepID=A0A1I0AX55_9FIRM|nr:AraC family transcriptional regulator [Natronincola peptidivorans]SES98979.1 AraC family transcriptional regulator [Natronincola peptidivorans]